MVINPFNKLQFHYSFVDNHISPLHIFPILKQNYCYWCYVHAIIDEMKELPAAFFEC